MDASPQVLKQGDTFILTITETPEGALSVTRVSAAFIFTSQFYKVISYDYSDSPFTTQNYQGIYAGVWPSGIQEQPYCLAVDRQSPTPVSGVAVIAKIKLQVLVSGTIINSMMDSSCNAYRHAWDQNGNGVTTNNTNVGFNLFVSPDSFPTPTPTPSPTPGPGSTSGHSQAVSNQQPPAPAEQASSATPTASSPNRTVSTKPAGTKKIIASMTKGKSANTGKVIGVATFDVLLVMLGAWLWRLRLIRFVRLILRK
jgi:hypothetical protein